MDYAITGTLSLYDGTVFILRGLNFFWLVDYFHRSQQDRLTSIQILPISAGLKYIYPKSKVRPYLGLGFKYYFVKLNRSYFLDQDVVRKNGCGGIVEIGALTFLAKYLCMDLFLSYSVKNFKLNDTTNLNVGGINCGAGLGLKF